MSDQEPKNVIAALAAVRRDLPGIAKDQQAAAAQGGYAYRGIESITAAVGPLLGRYGLVIVPVVLESEVRDITVGTSKAWTDTHLRVRYTVYGPGGIEDQIDIGPLVAVGRDGTDKGANKAMTQAYKQALLQVLCIGDSKDDADGQTHEAQATPPPADAPTHKAIRDAIAMLAEAQADHVKAWWAENRIPPISRADRLSASQADEVLAMLDTLDDAEPEPNQPGAEAVDENNA